MNENYRAGVSCPRRRTRTVLKDFRADSWKFLQKQLRKSPRLAHLGFASEKFAQLPSDRRYDPIQRKFLP
jgi:hypothetical protein